MMEVNRNLFPPDGYVFVERDGSRLRGEGWKDLEARIRGYRAINGMPPGDPWAEIQVQICSRNPSFCHEEGPPVPPQGHHSLTFNQRVLQWFVHAIGLKRVDRLGRVDDATAAARAEICARCPAQKSLNHACEGCLASIKESRKGLLNGATSLHQNLQPCAVLAEDCQTSVHVEQPPTDVPGLPGHCWRRPR
jgi:hypothetical protein